MPVDPATTRSATTQPATAHAVAPNPGTADAGVGNADRSGDRAPGPVPQERGAATRTARGAETRRLLLEAAGQLFAEQGYHATTVPDIVKAAGVGHGTFYEYFGSRHQILLALTQQAIESRGRGPRLQSTNLSERIRSEILWYLAEHVEHLQLWKVWHEASSFDADLAAARRAERARRVRRVRRGIEAAGAPPGVDVGVAAAALNAMLEEFAYRWFVEGDGPGTSAADLVAASETLSTIWLSAIGLTSPRS
jgi:AcrR family transcriptional regulator